MNWEVLAPVLTIVISVGLGAALGVLPGSLPRVTSPIRTFAVVAACAVVGLHFLPHTLEEEGVWGLLVTCLSFAVALGLDRLAPKREAGPTKSRAMAIGYAALLLHRLGDGAALASSEHGEGVLWAIGAHALPVVALITLRYRERGLQVALLRAVALGMASLLSFFVLHQVPELSERHFHGWMDAITAGILLNVAVNELSGGQPRTHGDRLVDLLAGAAGLLLVIGPGDSDEGMNLEVARRFVDLALHTAPMLLVGLAGGALLQALGPKLPARWLLPRTPLLDALRGTIYGAPLPLCSCSVLPLSRSLRNGGAAPALVVAFLIATPELGLETLTLSVQLLGWPFALFRLGGALLVAFVAGLTIARFSTPRQPATVNGPTSVDHPLSGNLLQRFLHAFEDLFLHIGGWILLGLVAAAYADALIPVGGLKDAGGPLLQLLIVTAIAVPSYVCAPSATPIAAALVFKGLAPGTVLVGLLLGPATNVATLLFLKRSFGRGALVAMLLAVTACTWALGLAGNLLLSGEGAVLKRAGHAESLIDVVGLGLLLLALSRGIWTNGIRGWLAASLSESGDHTHQHSHTAHGLAHGHAHAQAHSSHAH